MDNAITEYQEESKHVVKLSNRIIESGSLTWHKQN